ncbi:hypothetical protein [Catellatospora sichuanensis]|uniref:hypothetical protein n=1 Tax=Catellatospora sichuanensis TaxID=1969805 RepID=UPI001181DCF3|nr:hypothetical protein [Catellatospora sichuanensis]
MRHAIELEGHYYDIAPTLAALSACGDSALVPRLHEELDRFLHEENFYGRDLIASILAGIDGVAALPTLLRASSRDFGDDQDGLSAEIVDLLKTDRETARLTVLDLCCPGRSAARSWTRSRIWPPRPASRW